MLGVRRADAACRSAAPARCADAAPAAHCAHRGRGPCAGELVRSLRAGSAARARATPQMRGVRATLPHELPPTAPHPALLKRGRARQARQVPPDALRQLEVRRLRHTTRRALSPRDRRPAAHAALARTVLLTRLASQLAVRSGVMLRARTGARRIPRRGRTAPKRAPAPPFRARHAREQTRRALCRVQPSARRPPTSPRPGIGASKEEDPPAARAKKLAPGSTCESSGGSACQ